MRDPSLAHAATCSARGRAAESTARRTSASIRRAGSRRCRGCRRSARCRAPRPRRPRARASLVDPPADAAPARPPSRAAASAAAASSAIVARSQAPVGVECVSVTAAPPSAKSPWRRANSMNAQPVRGRQRRHVDLDQQLVGLERGRQVGDEELAPSRSCARRASSGRRTEPSSAASATGSSAAGSACAIEPPTVPRLRICGVGDEGQRLVQQRPVRPRRSPSARASTWRVSAPTRSDAVRGGGCTASAAEAVDVDQPRRGARGGSSAAARGSGRRPAPWPRRRARRAARAPRRRVSGAWYSKGGGFMCDLRVRRAR